VALTASGPGGTDTLTRTNYITVSSGMAYTTTHRVISYTYDSLYRLITATYSSGESYRYTYPSTSLRTGDAVVNLLQHGGQIRRSGWDDVFLTADVLMVWEVTQCGVVCRRSGRSRQ
jgi:PKD repeat protein